MASPCPPRVHDIPRRIGGLDLKASEQLTRRLFLLDVLYPIYSLPPPLPADHVPYAVLDPDSFSAIHPALDPASRPVITPVSAPPPIRPSQPADPKRGSNKRAQIRALISVLSVLIDAHPHPYPTIVDMCAGCGHLSLIIAALFPSSQVYLVDDNSVALSIAAKRANQANLSNIHVVCTSVQNFSQPFHIAVALHACAGASDAVISAAVRASAALLLVPCCVGGLVTSRGSVTGAAVSETSPVLDFCAVKHLQWNSARSPQFQSLLQPSEFPRLARAADFGENGVDDWRKLSKALLEWDRILWLRSAQYHARLAKIRPESCTPKNDLLVAWPIALSYIFTGDWSLDELANGFVRDVVEGSVLNGLGDAEVSEVERMLKDLVCDDDSPGFCRLSAGAGKRRRKVVHAVAESMGLWHRSDGKGIQRSVTVQRTPYWPLFFDRYVGIGGPIIETISEHFINRVPEALVSRRVLLRGRLQHMTIISPPDMKKLDPQYGKGKSALLALIKMRLLGSNLCVLGLGRVDSSTERTTLTSWDGQEIKTSLDFPANGGLQESYFVVVKWPQAQQLRNELGLPPKDFHITLGFTTRDIHEHRKDHNTIFYHDKREYSPWVQ